MNRGRLLKRDPKAITQDKQKLALKALDRHARLLRGRAETILHATRDFAKLKEQARKHISARKAKLARDLDTFDHEIKYWDAQAKTFAGPDYDALKQLFDARPPKIRVTHKKAAPLQTEDHDKAVPEGHVEDYADGP